MPKFHFENKSSCGFSVDFSGNETDCETKPAFSSHKHGRVSRSCQHKPALLLDLLRSLPGTRDHPLRTQLLPALHRPQLGQSPGRPQVPWMSAEVSLQTRSYQKHNSGGGGGRHDEKREREEKRASSRWAAAKESLEWCRNIWRGQVLAPQQPPGCLLLHRREPHLCSVRLRGAHRTQDRCGGAGTHSQTGTETKTKQCQHRPAQS